MGFLNLKEIKKTISEATDEQKKDANWVKENVLSMKLKVAFAAQSSDLADMFSKTINIAWGSLAFSAFYKVSFHLLNIFFAEQRPITDMLAHLFFFLGEGMYLFVVNELMLRVSIET